MFYKLNVPNPSNNLLSDVKDIAYNKPINYKSLESFKSVQPNYVNCAAGLFFVDDDINDQMQSLYKSFFSDEFVSTIGIIHNTTSRPASYPPHSDKFRRVGFNYYIDLGGENVETVFYDKVDDSFESEGGNVIPHDQLSGKVEKIKFEKDCWNLFHTRRFHSVENIETTRCLLTISFLNINFDQFQQKYQSLLLKPI